MARGGADLVRAYKPNLSSRLDIQSYIYALLNVAPEEAVRFVDEHWDVFERDDTRAESAKRGDPVADVRADVEGKVAGRQQRAVERVHRTGLLGMAVVLAQRMEYAFERNGGHDAEVPVDVAVWALLSGGGQCPAIKLRPEHGRTVRLRRAMS